MRFGSFVAAVFLAAALLVGLVVGWPAGSSATGSSEAAALPAAARTERVEWLDLRGGRERALESGRPLLVTVVTDWCPYCRKMQSNTWSAPDVARGLDRVVQVKLDAEDGATGSAVAARYGVRGFPTQLLLEADGSLVARADGYQSPRQLLDWLDGALARASGGAR